MSDKILNIYDSRRLYLNFLFSILETPDKRKCKIIGERELGVKYPNGTYSGILGLLQQNKAGILNYFSRN